MKTHTIEKVLSLFFGRCQYCGGYFASPTHVDLVHIVMKDDGSHTITEKIVRGCEKCIHDRIDEETADKKCDK